MYIIGAVFVLVLSGVVYLISNDLNIKVGNNDKVIPAINLEKKEFSTSSTKGSVENKYAGSHFICDGGKTIDGTFIFENGARAELKLTDGKTVRSMVLPQDLTAGKPVFKSKDGVTVLANKGDGSVSLLESGAKTFANCKAQ